MRFYSTVGLVALAEAIVLPDAAVFQQLPLKGQEPPKISEDFSGKDISNWWNKHVSSLKEGVASAFNPIADEVSSRYHDGVDKVEDWMIDAKDNFDTAVEDAMGGHHKHKDFPDLTIYDLIKNNDYTTKFAKLVDEYPDVADRLKSTEANHTLFVPVDSAFEHAYGADEHGKKPSKEYIESALKYHLAEGNYPAKRILTTHTIPTLLHEERLGGAPQRLRPSVGILSGVRLNFYSKVVAADFTAKNGHVHAVNHALLPPLYAGQAVALLPAQFSTLILAYERTNFADVWEGQDLIGVTTFAPSNRAFERLGLAANAFLFNTEKGAKYLKAILKYHFVPNVVVYTDEIYDNTGRNDASATSRNHYELSTLLKGKSLGVDVADYGLFSSIRLNGFARVTVADGVAKDGVVHVIDSVLIPPHRSHKHSDDTEDISVEDLMERLADFI